MIFEGLIFGGIPAKLIGQEVPMGKLMPRRTYWMYGIGGKPEEAAEAMGDRGFGAVVGGDAEAVRAVRAAGMEAWQCGGAFRTSEKDTKNLAVDIEGNPQMWFGSGSPNSRELRDRNLSFYAEIAGMEGLAGVFVDGCRFASPASGLMPFLTDFSIHSERRAVELGFDFALMKRDAAAFLALLRTGGSLRGMSCIGSPSGMLEWLTARPGIFEWLRFRRACATAHFRDIAGILHGAGKRMGVYIFAPSLASLVGQSYADLAPFVDVFAPMLYRNYPDKPGIACLNWELACLPDELGVADSPSEEALMELVLAFTGLADVVPSRRVRQIQSSVPPEAVGRETARARAQLPLDKELAPIVYIDDPDMEETARQVFMNGADGLGFFLFGGLDSLPDLHQFA